MFAFPFLLFRSSRYLVRQSFLSQKPFACISCCRHLVSLSKSQVRLEYIGALQPKKTEGSYSAGQVFLHRLFGYRGVILSCYQSRLFGKSDPGVDLETSNCFWYLVLKDQRDSTTNLLDGLTFLPDHQRESSVFSLPGVDYCSHTDVLPFEVTPDVKVSLAASRKGPIENEFFDTFFQASSFDPSPDLTQWLDERRRLLEVAGVYQETTDNIRVTAIPFFLGKRNHYYYWRYTIRLENLNPHQMPVVLRERCWKIICVNGMVEKVEGRGVVGMEPQLDSRTPVFQYYSHVYLKDKWGNMGGHFRFESLNQQRSQFDVKIPSFPLTSKLPDEEDIMYT